MVLFVNVIGVHVQVFVVCVHSVICAYMHMGVITTLQSQKGSERDYLTMFCGWNFIYNTSFGIS